MKNHPVIWLDGRFQPASGALVPHDDAGYLRGLGVFDTMKGANGQAVNAKEHLERLQNHCRMVLLHDPALDIDALAATAQRLLVKNGLTEGYARIRTQITAGRVTEMFGKPQNPIIMMMAVRADIPPTPQPVSLQIIADAPRIARCRYENCKRLDYTRSYLAKHLAVQAGADDALITNTDGNMACATTSNLFIVEGGKLVTPPLTDGVLDGITRRSMIATYHASEESISETRLMKAEGVLLTNSILGLRPVKSINGTAFAVPPDKFLK